MLPALTGRDDEELDDDAVNPFGGATGLILPLVGFDIFMCHHRVASLRAAAKRCVGSMLWHPLDYHSDVGRFGLVVARSL